MDEIDREIDIIRLQDLNGSVLKEFKPAGETRIEVDLSQYSSGVYFLNIHSTDNYQYQQKILKL